MKNCLQLLNFILLQPRTSCLNKNDASDLKKIAMNSFSAIVGAPEPEKPAEADKPADNPADKPAEEGFSLHSCFFELGGVGVEGGVLITQILEGPFSAVSKPNLPPNIHFAAC